jgi:hypothetical protein
MLGSDPNLLYLAHRICLLNPMRPWFPGRLEIHVKMACLPIATINYGYNERVMSFTIGLVRRNHFRLSVDVHQY